MKSILLHITIGFLFVGCATHHETAQLEYKMTAPRSYPHFTEKQFPGFREEQGDGNLWD